MNFINDRELARRFAHDDVPAKERLYYFLFFLLLVAFGTSSFVAGSMYNDPNQWDYLIDIVSVVFTLFGALYLYRTNIKGDGKEFIERYVGIGFPVIVQTVALAAILDFVLFIFIGDESLSDQASSYEVVNCIVLECFYYIRVNGAVKIASAGDKA